MQNKDGHIPTRTLQFLIIGSLLLLVIAVLAFKKQSQPAAQASPSALPEAQLERALSAGKPALAFFHSNTCEQCVTMIATVEQVYPEFASSVALVDVNVYDPDNEPMLKKVKLNLIPTIVLYDRAGQGQYYVGVIDADVLHLLLSTLVEEQ